MLMFSIGIISCEEDSLKVYDSVEGIYFDNYLDRQLADSSNYTFVYIEEDVIEVDVQMQTLGPQSDVDRVVNLRVSSENAEEGIDYILPQSCVIPANSSKLNYTVKLLRTPPLKEASKTIQFEIIANEHFTLPFLEEMVINKKVSRVHYKIEFSELFTSPPAAWNDEEICGVFLPEKLFLISRVLDIPRSDFNDPKKVTWAKFSYIRSEMNKYVMDESMKMWYGMPFDEEILDKDGNPLEF